MDDGRRSYEWFVSLAKEHQGAPRNRTNDQWPSLVRSVDWNVTTSHSVALAALPHFGVASSRRKTPGQWHRKVTGQRVYLSFNSRCDIVICRVMSPARPVLIPIPMPPGGMAFPLDGMRMAMCNNRRCGTPSET